MSDNEQLARFTQAFEYLKGIKVFSKKSEVADAMGMSRPYFSDAIKGTPGKFTEGFLRRFAAAYADHISAEWLVDGTGEMAKADPRLFRPHIPVRISAGPTGLNAAAALEGECEPRPVISPFAWYDFTATVEGDSMLPRLHSGDTVCCAWLRDPSQIRDGRIYVLDTVDGAVIKRVDVIPAADPSLSDSPDAVLLLRCSSLNPLYSPYTVPASSVLRIARVVGMYAEL